MKRFAENTTVSVGKTRGDIYALLSDWGISNIGFLDHFDEGKAELQFVWKRDDVKYAARFTIKLPTDKELEERAYHATQHYFLDSKFQKLKAMRGQQEHRVLYLWIKAALNAVETGIVSAEAIFLPFIVGKDGQTVAEAMLPRMSELLSVSPDTLLISR